jgi:hypothetical protein
MKKTTLTSVLAAALFSIGTAQATTILVDDFNAPSGLVTITDTTADGNSVANISSTSSLSTAATRFLAVNLDTKETSTGKIEASVGGSDGFLNFSVSTAERATGTVFWALGPLALGSGDSVFTLSIIASALGSIASGSTPNHIDLTFAGGSGSGFTLAADVSALGFMNPGTPINFGLSSTQSAELAGGGLLSLAFSGGQGWNLALDQFSIESSPANVPVPASAALFGIALVAMRLVGKKSVANKS